MALASHVQLEIISDVVNAVRLACRKLAHECNLFVGLLNEVTSTRVVKHACMVLRYYKLESSLINNDPY